MGYGFGNEPFGEFPFGGSDFAMQVLYDELPKRTRDEDEAAGGEYKKFVQAVSPVLLSLIGNVSKFDRNTRDPGLMRVDLLRHFAQSMGMTFSGNAEDIARTRADSFAQFRLIRHQSLAMEIVAKYYGFNLVVIGQWSDGIGGYTDSISVDFETVIVYNG